MINDNPIFDISLKQIRYGFRKAGGPLIDAGKAVGKKLLKVSVKRPTPVLIN